MKGKITFINNSKSGKLVIPAPMMELLGITEDNRDVEITIKDESLIVRPIGKEFIEFENALLNLREFSATEKEWEKYLLRNFKGFKIEVDNTKEEKNETLMFHIDAPTFQVGVIFRYVGKKLLKFSDVSYVFI